MTRNQELKERFQSERGLSPKLLSELVQKVLYLIAQRMSEENDKQEYVLVVFTGATAGFVQAFSAIEQLMLSGMQVRIVMSDAAKAIYGDKIDERLLSWPTASLLSGETWFCDLKAAKGVVVPMLSVSALSKISGLMADSLTTNLILQALFMGKPVVAAIDGCQPGNDDRKQLGLDSGTPALQEALGQRLIKLNDFGCSLVKSGDLGWVSSCLMKNPVQPVMNSENKTTTKTAMDTAEGGGTLTSKMVDTALVRRAIREKKAIQLGASGVITPLALELAQQQGLQIIH